MRNLKAFGLALVAIFATAALAATAASANQFHSGNTFTTITRAANANQNFQYEASGQTVVCTTVGGSGSMIVQTETEITF